MEWTHAYLLLLGLVAIGLAALEKAPLSVIGIGMIVAVGIYPLDARDALSGLANPAVVTVAALYVVGEAFRRTGAASILADRILHQTGGSELTVLLLVTVMAAILSAFVNNTLVVVTFLPVITTICRDTGVAPSRLLIPLSFASILGGMCTLVGTSTNILVDGVIREHFQNGDEAFKRWVGDGLSMFEMSLCGIIMAGAGILYLALIGRRLLPSIPSLAAQAGAQNVREFVTEITVGPGSSLIGTPVTEVGQVKGGSARPMMLVRNESLHGPRFGNMKVKESDILMVSGNLQDLTLLQRREGKGSVEDPDRYDPRTMTFFELALTPSSALVGRRIRDIALKAHHDAAVAGILRGGRHIRERFTDMTLSTGDVLLAFGDEKSKDSLRQSPDFHLVEGVSETIYRTERAPIAGLILLGVVTLFVTGVMEIAVAALAGALAMVLTGCLSVRQAHNAVNWPILLFIAGTIALSRAAGHTPTGGESANDALAAFIVEVMPQNDPRFLLAAIFISTIVLTEILSNNAVAVILTPVAIAVARADGMADPRPLIMAVLFGASCCFANPVAYTTNLLVLGPGGYRFKHFLRVGLPMDIILGVVGIMVIPWFWPV